MIWPLPGTRSSPQRSILVVFTTGMCATSELRRSRRRVPGECTLRGWDSSIKIQLEQNGGKEAVAARDEVNTTFERPLTSVQQQLDIFSPKEL